MGDVRLTATGPAEPATVWERYADTRLWPTWSPHIRRVEVGEGSPRLRPGLAGQVVGPLGVRVTFVVDEVDERAMTWSWHVRVGPVRLALDHGVRAHDDGTLTVLHIAAPSAVAAAYAPLAQVALQRLVRA